MRLLIQSKTTGKFLVPASDGGEPVWVRSLREAGGGVVGDLDTVNQLVEDNCDFEDMPTLIDLDRLGTPADYTPRTT
ncbi:MAG: hypothetical protein JWQ72_1898 [Polaromonas sp.]|nr:hypothetical protein [Polaromonas sp.]